MLHTYSGNMDLIQVIVNFLKKEAEDSHYVILEWILAPTSVAETFLKDYKEIVLKKI